MFQFSDSESVEVGRDAHFHHGAEPGDRFDGRVETFDGGLDRACTQR
jgi:hypothetical protein